MSDVYNPMPVRTDGDLTEKLQTRILDGSNDANKLTVNADGSINITDNGGVITVDATNLDIRDLTSASDSVAVLQATHDNLNANANLQVNDVDVSISNPIPVTLVDAVGVETNDFNTAASVAGAASSNHDYTPASAFRLQQVVVSSSGAAKMEVRVETAAGSGIFNTKFVQFTSASSLNMDVKLASPILVPSGAIVRVIRTNRDNKALDLYSTISGQLI